MAEEMMKEGAPMPAEGGEGAQDPMEVMMTLGSALTQIRDSMSQGNFPPEAIQALDNAAMEYEKFMSIMGGGKSPAPGNQQAEMMGAQGAVPAGQPVGKDVIPA